MCRISVLHGQFNEAVASYIAQAQANGSNVAPEIFKTADLQIVLSRFAVTSEAQEQGTFPLESDRYAIAYNGEVFSCKNKSFKGRRYKSDVHFALDLIENEGLHTFLKHADFQGTFVIHDKQYNKTHIITDQLNTAGCFYAEYDGKIIVAQEYPIVHKALELASVPANTPINIVPNGAILTIDDSGKTSLKSYRPYSDKVWSGKPTKQISALVSGFNNMFAKLVAARIPETGPVGILLSGGVDSSYVFHYVHKYLKDRGELNRLRIFTLGAKDTGLPEVENDLLNVEKVLHHYGLNLDTDLHIIPRNDEKFGQLLRETVFSNNPRLIPANPVQTQIRHTVRMSTVLNHIAITNPSINVVLTGDFADEIFGGYNAMHQGHLLTNVRQRLNQLPLNDAGRVILASMHGTKALGASHPIEIRSPFSSHLLLDFITKLPPELLVGNINNEVQTKFFLRVCALEAGLLEEIALRQKVPFNQGGTGTRNGSRSDIELQAAQVFASEPDIARFCADNSALLARLGISGDIAENHESYTFVMAAMQAGLNRLALGNTFPAQMPDSRFATNVDLPYYIPALPSYVPKTSPFKLI